MKSLRSLSISIIIVFGLSVLNSCAPSWSETFQSGSISKQDFTETINMELIKGVIIIPVEINGKTYRFLFDTGAINSISEEMQEELDFKQVSTGHLKDSDNNRTKVKYVNVDTLSINGIEFYNQTSFVGDFNANPVLRCMKLDGILGSNVMHFCNWTIDYKKEEITLSNEKIEEADKETFTIPFETDRQYSQFIDLKIGDKSITHVKVDYGSNGSLSIPNSAFKKLKEYELIEKTTFETGFTQSGIVGKTLVKKDEITIVDSLYHEDLKFRNVLLESGGNGLLGSKIFSNWIVTIDWQEQVLLFQAQEKQKTDQYTFGLGIGYSEKLGAYIQTIIQGSPAEEAGIAPKMKVLKIGDISFNEESDFCRYIHFDKKEDSIKLEFVDFDGNTHHKTLLKDNYSLK